MCQEFSNDDILTQFLPSQTSRKLIIYREKIHLLICQQSQKKPLPFNSFIQYTFTKYKPGILIFLFLKSSFIHLLILISYLSQGSTVLSNYFELKYSWYTLYRFQIYSIVIQRLSTLLNAHPKQCSYCQQRKMLQNH